MKTVLHGRRPEFIALCLCALFLSRSGDSVAATTQGKLPERKFLYVAEPGIRNYLEYGGHPVPGFYIVPSPPFRQSRPFSHLPRKGQPPELQGSFAHAGTHRGYVSTTAARPTSFPLTQKN